MIGLKSGTVRLEPHRAAWRGEFGRERRRLLQRFARRRCQVEHIGSTAIPGLDAKPIIDMAILIPSFKRLPLWIGLLEAAGYLYKGEYGLSGRHFFTKGDPVTHHLHLVEPTSIHWNRWMLFRNYLRANPTEAVRYNACKQSLARRYAGNREAYTKAKSPVIDRILARAAKHGRTA